MRDWTDEERELARRLHELIEEELFVQLHAIRREVDSREGVSRVAMLLADSILDAFDVTARKRGPNDDSDRGAGGSS